jgi:hypothetical protein
MCDVFVIVNVNVLVCELNSQTRVAVENPPLSTPTIETVSALAGGDTEKDKRGDGQGKVPKGL